jgi:uncharacterized protein (DUF2141 family)
MIHLTAFLLALSALQPSEPPSAAPREPAEIVFTFSGLTNSGAVMIALYDSEASYKSRVKPLRQARAPVSGGRAEARMSGLAPGAYAAMVFHDVNGDGKMNFNRLKLPAEPYAFSNNAKGLPLASWKAATFVAAGGPARQDIRLR